MNPPEPTHKIANRRYVYAIVDGGELPAVPLNGLFDKPVTLLAYQDIAAAVSAVDVAAMEPEVAQLLRHEEVVETLMVERSTLPVRFGAVFSSEEQVIATLASQYPDLKADLRRLDGHVEIGLRILWDEEQANRAPGNLPTPAARETAELQDRPAGDDGSGRAYLRTRMQATDAARQLRRQAEDLEQRCRQRVESLAVEIKSHLLVTKGTPVSAAFLVPRAGMDALLAELNQFQAENPDLTLLCTGPWPPYNFIQGDRS